MSKQPTYRATPGTYVPTPTERRNLLVRRLGRKADNWDRDVLQILADGPIMNPTDIYLPAGRLSHAQAAARERRIRNGEPC